MDLVYEFWNGVLTVAAASDTPTRVSPPALRAAPDAVVVEGEPTPHRPGKPTKWVHGAYRYRACRDYLDAKNGTDEFDPAMPYGGFWYWVSWVYAPRLGSIVRFTTGDLRRPELRLPHWKGMAEMYASYLHEFGEGDGDRYVDLLIDFDTVPSRDWRLRHRN